MHIFAVRLHAMQCTVLFSQFCLFVCLSVTRVHCYKTDRYFDTTRKGNHSATLTPIVVCRRRTFRPKFALKVTHSTSAEIVLPKLFQNNFRGLLQLMNIFRHV